MVIGAFYYVHVDKSIPWTVIGCWPRKMAILACVYIYVYIYIYTRQFSNVMGSVLSYSLFYFCLPAGYLTGTTEPVSIAIIVVYSARYNSDFYS